MGVCGLLGQLWCAWASGFFQSLSHTALGGLAGFGVSSKFHKSSLFHLTGGDDKFGSTVMAMALATVEAGFWPSNRQVQRQVATGVAMMT